MTDPAPSGAPLREARERLEHLEEEQLARFAAKSARARRRIPVDSEGRVFDYRTEYQRDRDRIIHARAFRRLRDKGPAHLADDGDRYRSHLTHSLEVGQLGRTMARALRLNEDLVEAIALGHDLGSPPLAPGGEEALDGLLSGGIAIDGFPDGGTRSLGGFDVPGQSLRVVDLLEKRYDHPGINLTDDTRAGIWKQDDPLRSPEPDGVEGLEPGAPPSAEAQVVRASCRIASTTHRLDDLLQARPELLGRFEDLRLLEELRRKLGRRYRRGSSRYMRRNLVHRGLLHLLVTDTIHHTASALERWAERERIESAARFHDRRGALPPSAVGPSERVDELLTELEGLLERCRSSTQVLARRRARGRRTLAGLFRASYADPTVLDDYVLLRFRESEGIRYLRDLPQREVDAEVARHYRGSPHLVRLICDHLAGMTDGYATAEFRALCLGGPSQAEGR